jgi:hypothetical protein
MDPIVAAAFGGLAPRLIDLALLSHIPERQRPNIDRYYAIPFIIMPFISMMIAYIYIQSGISLTPILAFNVGISAPLIVKSAAEAYKINKRGDIGPEA